MKKNFQGGLRREIGLREATLLVIANMVGTGVFTTSGFILSELGSAHTLLVCWIIGGLFALAGALCYGELGAMMPHAGGEYVYLRRSFGILPAFVSGWISLMVGFSAPIAAAAIGFATYLLGGNVQSWYTLEWSGIRVVSLSPVTVIAIASVVLFSLVHFHSVRLGKNVQSLLTFLKIAFIVTLLVAGFGFGNGDASRVSELLVAKDDPIAWGRVAVALIFVSFAYSGWNAAAYLGGEIINPERNLPLSLLIGTVFVCLLYLLLNLLYVYALPAEVMAAKLEVGLEAANVLFGKSIGSVFGMVIALGLLSVISAMIMAGPRVYYAMARDGMFFSIFGKVDEAHNTPAYSIFFQAALAVVMIVTATFDVLLMYIGFTLSLSSMLTVLGLMWMRWKEPDAPRPYKTFGYPVVPILFIAGNLWIVLYMVSSRPIVGAVGLLTVLSGVAFFTLFARKEVIEQDGSCCEACES